MRKLRRDFQLILGCYVVANLNLFIADPQKMVRVFAKLFVSLQDQPERCGANYIMGGNGTHTARFGMAADLYALSYGIPACQECLTKYLLSENPQSVFTMTGTCENCVM